MTTMEEFPRTVTRIIEVDRQRGAKGEDGSGAAATWPVDGTPQRVLDLGSGATQYATTTDPRLSDARTPLAHQHSQSDIAGLTTALAGKANAGTLASKADLVDGVVPTSQIPAVALVTAVPVASESAMLTLTPAQVQPGDIAIRTDGAGSFVLTAADPTQLASWVLLNAPTDKVLSVNGQVGTVVLGKSDVGLGNVNNTADANKPVSTAMATALAAKADVSALASYALLTDSRLTDPRAAKVVDRGVWAAATTYAVGDVVTYAGRRWVRLTAGTSGSTFTLTNWVLAGIVEHDRTLFDSGVWSLPEHLRSGSPLTTTALSQNTSSGLRFATVDAVTLTAVRFETTVVAGTNATIDVQLKTYDRASNTLGTLQLLGSIANADLTAIGVKTLSGLSVALDPALDYVLSLCARTATGGTIKTTGTLDPGLTATGFYSGFTGTNQATALSTGTTPVIQLLATR